MNDFNQKPFLVSSESKIQIDSKNYHVYLDINNRSRIEGLYYICDKNDPWFEAFNSLAKVMEGVLLSGVDQAIACWKDEYKALLKEKILLLPELLFHFALEKYHGRSHNHESLSHLASEQLICRCFGVYEGHIEDYVKSNPKASVLDIADDLKASVGCGGCHSKVVEFLDQSLSKNMISNMKGDDLSNEFDAEGGRIRPLGLSPSDFVLKIDQLKKDWMIEQELSRYNVEIVGIRGLELGFRISPEDNDQYILDTLKEYLESKLNLVLSFNLL